MNMMTEAALSQPNTVPGPGAGRFFDYTTPRVLRDPKAQTPIAPGGLAMSLPTMQTGALAMRPPISRDNIPPGLDLSKVKSADAPAVTAPPTTYGPGWNTRDTIRGNTTPGAQMNIDYGPGFGGGRIMAMADKQGKINSFSDATAAPPITASVSAPAAAAAAAPGSAYGNAPTGAGGYPLNSGDIAPNPARESPYQYGEQPHPGGVNIGPGGADPYGINADVAASRMRLSYLRSNPNNVLNNLYAVGEQKRLNKMQEAGINLGQLGVQRGQLGVSQGQLGVARGQLGVHSRLADIQARESDTHAGTLGLHQDMFKFDKQYKLSDPERAAKSRIAQAIIDGNVADAYRMSTAWGAKAPVVVAQGPLKPIIADPYTIPPNYGVDQGTPAPGTLPPMPNDQWRLKRNEYYDE